MLRNAHTRFMETATIGGHSGGLDRKSFQD